MIQNYISTALRNLRKHKLQAAINLGGLSISLCCCLLIALYIKQETGFDRQPEHSEQIWRVTRSFHDQDGTANLHLSAIAPPFKYLLTEHFPEIQQITSTLQYTGTVRTSDAALYPEQNMFFADENLLSMFSLRLISGNPESALRDPWQVILSEKTARKYFGNQNPLDQILGLDNQYKFKVAGVFPDFPAASHWHPELLFSFNSLQDSLLYGAEALKTNFGNNAFYTYFLAAADFRPEKMSARFPDFLDAVFPPPPAGQAQQRKPSEGTQLHLQQLRDIHLKSHHDDEIEPGGDADRVRMFGFIAAVLLLIAGINYVNLSTAFSLSRTREIGVRKSAGARRSQIVFQFLVESVLLTLSASILAFGLAALALPWIKNKLGVPLSAGMLSTWYVPAGLLGVACVTGILAGLYPAFFLSSFKPVLALKGNSPAGKGRISIRKVLVVTQFCVSMVLLVGTLVISRQLHFLQTKSLGLERERIINIAQPAALVPKWESFRSELLEHPNILHACRSSRIPSGRLLDDLGGTSVQIGDTMSPLTATLKMLGVDMDFVSTYQMSMAAGRDFSRDFPSDSTQGWLLNEAAVRIIGWKKPEDAIGKRLIYGGRKDCYVVGVLRDFHFESLHQEIVPMIFFIPRQKTNLNVVSIKIGPNVKTALAEAATVWNRFNPDFPFNYTFLDENFGRLYEAEQRQADLYLVFAGLAIFIACLGLFGLATFAAHQRTKEIGIRKVLGATVSGITGLLAKDFLKLVCIAILIASPIAYYFMETWLSDFAYRIDLQWWMFALTGLIAIAIAFLTVSFQSIRAALNNPVKSLRSE